MSKKIDGDYSIEANSIVDGEDVTLSGELTLSGLTANTLVGVNANKKVESISYEDTAFTASTIVQRDATGNVYAKSLVCEPDVKTKKVVLFESTVDPTSFYGMGVSASLLDFYTARSNTHFSFKVSETAPVEIARLTGTGVLQVDTLAGFTSGGANISIPDPGEASTMVTTTALKVFNMNLTGPWASDQLLIINYVKQGKVVTLHFSNTIAPATISSNITSTNVLPAEIRPGPYHLHFPLYVTDNATDVIGLMQIANTGDVTITSKDDAPFQGTGNANIRATSISYIQDLL